MWKVSTKTSESTPGIGSTNRELEPIIVQKHTEIQPQCQATSANKGTSLGPAEKKLIFNIALVSGELDRGATFELPPANPGPRGEKCSTCQSNKPYNQSWPEHNRSESHIRHLILSGRFGPALETITASTLISLQ